jgi:EAL domain-containing protein (putative c-di-GMP-specific phosphodiesterase class I)
VTRFELERAITENELVLHFQPIVDIRSKSCVAVEALARWRHPERGLMEAFEFIPIAEETGFIKALGLWALNEAIRWRSTWRESRKPPIVSVNLSTRNLHAVELPDIVASTLSMWSVPPSALALEVTETAVMGDTERSLEIVRRLHEMGVTIAIDDFGVGYSSLVQLQRMRADHLKIDRTFVMNLRRDPNSQAIVGSTVLLAHSLGMKATAEGVEDKETWERLSVLGCDLAQGHFLAPPMPAADLARWFAESPWAAIE